MINHARTLLLNAAPTGFRTDRLFEEIIPDDYVVRTLTQPLLNVRRAIFGAKPDRTMLNYRARQLMCLLANSELQEFVTALDPRITYELDDKFNVASGFSYDQTFSTGNPLYFISAPFDSSVSGQMLHEWTMSYPKPLAVISKSYEPVTETPTVTFTGGISNVLALPASPLSVRFSGNSAAKWNIRYMSVPDKDLGQVLADIDMLGEETLTGLFGIGTPLGKTEPFVTFYNLWRTNPFTPYRLGAVVLALIYQTDRL